ncbi:MAG: NAD-binding protein, partial [Rhizorhabdus sp.]
ILAGAILSIFVNPFVFTAVAGRVAVAKKVAAAEAEATERERELERREHAVLVGYGRVGELFAAAAKESGRALVIVEEQRDVARSAVRDGFTVVTGSATDPRVLDEAGVQAATKLIIAVPEGFEAAAIAERARAMNKQLAIFARAHSDDESAHLKSHGVEHVVTGEHEIANALTRLVISSRSKAAPVEAHA